MSLKPKIRVLIAEDSSTFRDLLAGILTGGGPFEIIGAAVNGLEAVEMTRRLHPDVVMMDINMPVIDGLKATQRIMEESPTPIVVVTASVLFGDVAVTLNALNAGALAVLRKPAGPRSETFADESAHIVATVKAMAGVKVIRRRPRPGDGKPPSDGVPAPAVGTYKVIAIAASTGGPAAVRRILADLPAVLPVPILLVQHIAQGFGPGLAEWLGSATGLVVKMAVQGEILTPGTVYIGTDGGHLGVSRDLRIRIAAEPPIAGIRPSATFLFESVAAVYGSAVLAVILTGMGEDGVAGLHAVRDRGGAILAQDEQTSVVFGMPAKAIEAGLVDAVLPVEEIGLRISRMLGHE